MTLIHIYKTPGPCTQSLLKNIQQRYSCNVEVKSEFCYNISCSKPLTVEELERLKWILAESMSVNSVFEEPQLQNDDNNIFIEVGPRMNFATPFSTNAVSICHSIGLRAVLRIELSRCYMLKIDGEIPSDIEQDVYSLLYDRMTEMRYKTKLTSFDVNITPEQVYEIDIMRRGCEALEEANSKLGLAFDAWDLDYYTELFTKQVGRNPTSVECFDLAQSNSEHSRHWFFKGRMVMDGVEKEKCLMQLVSDTQLHSNNNSVIAFSDNSSAIQGFKVTSLLPQNSTESSDLKEESLHRHIIFTAETHNFPTGVAPFPGATTGTGGRIRDVQAAGRGAHVIAGTAGYCFGNLNIPGYKLAWEDSKLKYPSNFALPLQVAIEASNGASDYGNKFGEPVITGFARSFGMLVNDETAERIEWIKPIMFSGGIGSIEANHVNKHTPEPGMKVVKVGGPVYRIGVGGGAASSIQVQGDNAEELDYGAVQRGDAEMEQKMNRVVRACIEMGEKNPIKSIHDQGAGGNGNVLKEISEPAGAVIHAEQFRLGDPTLSLMEVWGAEYQESNALLVEARDQLLLEKIARREKCDVSFVGDISGDGRVVFKDETSTQPAFDLPLDVVLGKMPQKVFQLSTKERKLFPLKIPQNLSIIDALDRVLRLPSVASKRYLTNKVDRSVTGLVAQQQCVGPLHTPLADVGVVALSHFDVKGAATAIGEQPIKCLLDARKGARCTVAEAFTNLVFAKITNIKDVKCSGNWMWPAKLEGEGSRLYEACEAMCEMLSQLGAAVDGGKDSLSMAARLDDAVVKSPGSLVVSLYAPSPDVRARVTPELKGAGNHLLYVKWSGSKEWRLGGSALVQVYNQLGDQCPDVNNFELFSHAFTATQQLIGEGLIVSGHDVSDGGLITTLLEMAFASGNLSFSVDQVLPESQEKRLAFFFAEEPAIVLEVAENNVERLKQVFMASGVSCVQLGMVTDSPAVILENTTLVEDIKELHRVWEATSFQLERLQCNVDCVEEEEKSLFERNAHPQYDYSFTVQPPPTITSTFNVAIIREEGSNGDREMASAFHMAGFRVHDVTMSDLCHGSVSLEQFVGLAFVGGFSYADVLGSAKGWASVAKFNQCAKDELERFRLRPDTFSLGVCNGCQLMALLGWVGGGEDASPPKQQVCFDHNKSGRFESRFSSVRIDKTPSIMLRGMEGACLGVWVAHGEGRIRGDALEALNQQRLVAIRYVDDAGKSTESYPMNPNGSPAGVASLCSMDGRHLAMMPHPERCTQMWQWAWSPPTWKAVERSPWLQMFYNAHKWCQSNR